MKNTKEIRKKLKETLGYNARQVSVKKPYYGEIVFTIRDASVNMQEVKEFAENYKSISYCPVSHEILSGGNTFVSVYISDKVEEEWAKKWLWLLEEARDSFSEDHGVRVGRFTFFIQSWNEVKVWDEYTNGWLSGSYRDMKNLAVSLYVREQKITEPQDQEIDEPTEPTPTNGSEWIEDAELIKDESKDEKEGESGAKIVSLTQDKDGNLLSKTTFVYSNRHLAGEYKPTALDAAKVIAPFLLTSVCYGYAVKPQTDGVKEWIFKNISKRSIKAINENGRINLTEPAFYKLAAQYPNYQTDF